MTPLVIFSDLDGTLLNHHDYRFDEAITALNLLKKHQIPCILNTSKTYAELAVLNQQLALNAPFIIENGAAVYLPKANPLNDNILKQDANIKPNAPYIKKPFGPSREQILTILHAYKPRFSFTGFADMTTDALIQVTQLPKANAKLALQREFTEPLLWQDSEEAFALFQGEMAQHGLQLQRGGRFIHVMGEKCDKALAMQWLIDAYCAHYQSNVTSMALGDGGNDVAMIAAADIGIVIRSPVHEPITIPKKDDVYITKHYGPAGWSEAVIKVLKQRNLSH
ncbi:HAD-IIB family hydrolase [Marinomonas agarivorans]|nr:HAD-IIB family hydrolase [Marinomonas agarivorans]